MYSDLFEHLGGGGGGGLSRAAANAAAASSGPPEDPRLVTFKAGKIRLQPTDRGTYMCEADPTRGEVRLVASADGGGRLEWQWFDRRDNVVIDRRVVEQPPAVAVVPATTATPAEGEEGKEEETPEGKAEDETTPPSSPEPVSVHPAAWTFRKIDPPLPTRTHKDDRVYVFAHAPITTTSATAGGGADSHDLYDLYWMQDADPSHDDDLVEQINQYLSDPAKAVAEATGGATATGAASGMGVAGSLRASGGAAAASSSSASASAQVDALSTILENLGMPQSSSSSEAPSPSTGGASGTDGVAASASAPRNTLTLADLQGAMAGIQQQQARASAPSIALSDVVTSDAISSVLNDVDARDRLLALLPEDQRTPELLEENLRSPQVRQTLRLLTQALLPDDDGRVDGFLSVVANFQLPSPAEGGGDAHQALVVQASTNPIQAFLDAIVRSVQQEDEAAAAGTSGGDAMDAENNDEAKESHE